MAKVKIGSISLDCADPSELAMFWASLLGGEIAFSSDGFVAVKLSGLWLTAVRIDDYRAPTWPEGETPKQMHIDVAVDDLEGAQAEALRLGATRADFQTAPDRFVVLYDPAGHPFCLTTQIPD